MSQPLVLLVLLMTTFLSSLFSPASGFPIGTAQGSWGINRGTRSECNIPGNFLQGNYCILPGDVLLFPLSDNPPVLIRCITIGQNPDGTDNCVAISDLPNDMQFKFTNSDVAEVSVETNGFIRLKKPGSTSLQLRQVVGKDVVILASSILVVTPALPGTLCNDYDSFFNVTRQFKIADCSGKCVELADVLQRLGDGTCDDGTERHDRKQPLIDLSCAFTLDRSQIGTSLEGFVDIDVFVQDAFEVNGPLENPDDVLADRRIAIDFSINTELQSRPDIDTYIRINLGRSSSITTDLDRGDCSLRESCKAQFGDAPGYEFCSAISGASVCSFNATTGTRARSGTCMEMCQQFGSRCVAALNNNPNDPPSCTPRPNSRDTCDTPRQTEICVCERR